MCLALTAPVQPAAAQAGATQLLRLTLEEALALALADSRAAISARLDREEQALSLEAAEERYDPRFDLGASTDAGSRGDESANLSLGPSLRVPTGGSFRLSWRKPLAGGGNRRASTVLTFSQPLLEGFGTDIDTQPLRRARLQERVNLRAFRDTVAGIVRSVVSAYRGVLSAKRRLVITREALERARRQLEINRAMVEAGRMAPQDLIQTESEVTNREYSLNDAENRLETANATFINTLDLEEGVRIDLEEEPPIRPEQPALDESLETAFARRTDWLRAEIGLELARMSLRAAQNRLLPDLSLSASVSRGDADETDWSVRLNLAVPFPDNEPERALARARFGLRRAEMDLAERRQSIRIQVRRAVRTVAVALRQVDLARRARELAERKLEVERLKMQQGLSSAYQLGRFEDDLVSAQNRQLDARVGYREALEQLDSTLGTTLDRWGIRVEELGPGPDERPDGAAGGLVLRLRPSAAEPSPVEARDSGRLEDGPPAFAVSRHTPEAVEHGLAAARGARAQAVRSLMLSLREFESATTASRAASPEGAGTTLSRAGAPVQALRRDAARTR